MKTKLTLLIAAIVILSMSGNAQKYRKYSINSGMFSVVISGTTNGTKVTWWDEYGFIELSHDISETKVFGQKTKVNKYELIKGADIYTWEEGGKEVTKSTNPMMQKWIDGKYTEKDMEKFANDIMKELNFKKEGTGTVIGKPCDIWTSDLGKVWAWKGFGLKSETKLMGMTINIVADKFEEGSVSADKFEIPKGMKIKTIEAQATTPDDAEQIKQAKEMMKGLFK